MAATVAALVVVLTSGATPGALLIRDVFNADAAKTKRAMEQYTAKGIVVRANQRYSSDDPAATLDVYYPQRRSSGRLPTVVWVHGGAWVSGHPADAAPYFTLIAAQGYSVVSIGYSLAPEHHYPKPIHEINDALGYLQRNARRLRIDRRRIFLAGDSAGAQIVSQIAALTTNTRFARDLRVEPALERSQLRGVVLHCGIYDMVELLDSGRFSNVVLRFGISTVVRAYTGSKSRDSAAIRQASTMLHVTARFPPTFISGGNADPLTGTQSRPFAAKLQRLGVPVRTRFFPADEVPALPHEYQFELSTGAARRTLQETFRFLAGRSAGDPRPLSSRSPAQRRVLGPGRT